MRLLVTFRHCPETWADEGKISLFWQSRVRPPEHTSSKIREWEIEIPLRDGKWSGPSVGRNSDGRRFLYFSWCNEAGRMFRRVKLYQNQVVGDSVVVSGVLRDGSPACSTAIIIVNE